MVDPEVTREDLVAEIRDDVKRIIRKLGILDDQTTLMRRTQRTTDVVNWAVTEICTGDSATAVHYPAFTGYTSLLGAVAATTSVPTWIGGGVGATFQTWSSPQFYVAGGDFGSTATPLLVWYGGPMGTAPDFILKNNRVAKVVYEVRAAFPDNADYGAGGIGCSDAGTGDFASTMHCFYVSRDTGDWVLASADASTLSETKLAGADGDFHNFRMEWESGKLVLFIDDVKAITKTTNLPAEPMRIHTREATANDIRIVALQLRWDGGASQATVPGKSPGALFPF